MSKIKFFIQAGEGHVFSFQGKELKHHDKPMEIEVKSSIDENKLSFEIPDSNGIKAALGARTLTSVTITKSKDHTYVLGNYAENDVRIANCCASNSNCGVTVCGDQAWASCPDGSQNCC